jgi:hypothetical protein
VKATLLCPAHSETSRTLHPAATRMATKLCRSPWKVKPSRPARATAGCQTRRAKVERNSGPPLAAVNTSASDSVEELAAPTGSAGHGGQSVAETTHGRSMPALRRSAGRASGDLSRPSVRRPARLARRVIYAATGHDNTYLEHGSAPAPAITSPVY